METKYKITIPKPCHEDWNAMTPEESGRFCSVCTKHVIDFTSKSASEIQTYLQQNKDKKICGRFKNNQINKFDIQIPQSLLRQPMPFQKAFLLMLFIVMGSSLFSCKNHKDETLGEVNLVEDSVKTCTTTGKIMLPNEHDSEQNLSTTVGKVKYNPDDSTQIPPPPPPPKLNNVKSIKEKKHSKPTTNRTVHDYYKTGVIIPEPEKLKTEEPTRIDSIKK